MPTRFSTFLKKKILKKDQNLISLNDPYQIIAQLLAGKKVSGIIDAGASNGHISSRLLQRFSDAKIYAFEPNPLYREQLSTYGKTEPRFCPQFFALSDSDGVEDLHITESPGNTSLCKPTDELKKIDPAGSPVKAVEQVKTVTIDNWAARNGDIPIELMKFDIQGGELKAMQGGRNVLTHSTLLVYTEVWYNSIYEGGALFSDIDLLLRECGFVLYDVFKPRYNLQKQLMWGNALYLKPCLI
jgi:FkbM family methyltransferase